MVLRNKSANSGYVDLLGGLPLRGPTYRVYTGPGYLVAMCAKSNTALANIPPIRVFFLSVRATGRIDKRDHMGNDRGRAAGRWRHQGFCGGQDRNSGIMHLENVIPIPLKKVTLSRLSTTIQKLGFH